MDKTVQPIEIDPNRKLRRRNKLRNYRKAVMRNKSVEKHPYFFTNICGYSGISYWDTTTHSWG